MEQQWSELILAAILHPLRQDWAVFPKSFVPSLWPSDVAHLDDCHAWLLCSSATGLRRNRLACAIPICKLGLVADPGLATQDVPLGDLIREGHWGTPAVALLTLGQPVKLLVSLWVTRIPGRWFKGSQGEPGKDQTMGHKVPLGKGNLTSLLGAFLDLLPVQRGQWGPWRLFQGCAGMFSSTIDPRKGLAEPSKGTKPVRTHNDHLLEVAQR